MDVSLECRSLCFAYGQSAVLSDISFDVEQGKFCAILGRNGSGKTTLLHCLNKILVPDQGRIIVQNRDITTLSQGEIAKHISLVPQEHLDIFPFKVLDVVVMGRTPFLSLTRRPGPGDYELARDALNALNAGTLAHKNFNRISGGERRIALLARALTQAAGVMLLDEPTNHLDFNNQFRLLSTIKSLCREKGISIVASMHDPNLASLFADDVIMVKSGTIMAKGPVREVMTQTHINALYETRVSPVALNSRTDLFFPAPFTKEMP